MIFIFYVLEATATNLISDALADVGTVISKGVEIATGNPVFLVFIGLGIAGAGIGFFKRLTRR